MKSRTIKQYKIFFLTCILLIGSITTTWSQSSSDSFLVRDVVIEAEYNPRFIRRIAEMGIPWDRVTKRSDVECVKEKLLSTGLFKNVETRFFELKDSGGYQLILNIQNASSPPAYKIGNVNVVGVTGVDNMKFQKQWQLETLSKQLLLLKDDDYAAFEDRLFELLEDSIEDVEQKDWKRIPWVDIKLTKNKELEITISDTFKGCP